MLLSADDRGPRSLDRLAVLGDHLTVVLLQSCDPRSDQHAPDHRPVPQAGAAVLICALVVRLRAAGTYGLDAPLVPVPRDAAQALAVQHAPGRSVLPMMICFIPSFMLLGIVPAVVSAVFNAFV